MPCNGLKTTTPNTFAHYELLQIIVYVQEAFSKHRPRTHIHQVLRMSCAKFVPYKQ